jgi:hypothetical protein
MTLLPRVLTINEPYSVKGRLLSNERCQRPGTVTITSRIEAFAEDLWCPASVC